MKTFQNLTVLALSLALAACGGNVDRTMLTLSPQGVEQTTEPTDAAPPTIVPTVQPNGLQPLDPMLALTALAAHNADILVSQAYTPPTQWLDADSMLDVETVVFQISQWQLDCTNEQIDLVVQNVVTHGYTFLDLQAKDAYDPEGVIALVQTCQKYGPVISGIVADVVDTRTHEPLLLLGTGDMALSCASHIKQLGTDEYSFTAWPDTTTLQGRKGVLMNTWHFGAGCSVASVAAPDEAY